MFTREDETRLIIRDNVAYRIQFHHDDDPQNPWEDCDGMTPMLARVGQYTKDYSQGHYIEDPLNYMTPQFIARNRAKIFEILDVSESEFELDFEPGYCRVTQRQEWCAEYLSELYDSDKFDAIAALWNLAGVPAESTCATGYSQGHYTELLFVAHPDAIKSWGFKSIAAYVARCGEGFEGETRTYQAWAFGDVMGYTVETISNEEIELAGFDSPHDMNANDANSMTYCEDVDSCWGFYPESGKDFDSEYADMIAQAMDAIPNEKDK